MAVLVSSCLSDSSSISLCSIKHHGYHSAEACNVKVVLDEILFLHTCTLTPHL